MQIEIPFEVPSSLKPCARAIQSARNPITRSQRHPRRKAATLKSPSILRCESPLEEEAAARFEACPDVVAITAQPRTFRYEFLGQTRRTTPDFELVLADGTIIYVEVKHSNQLRNPDLIDLLRARQDHCIAHGIGYFVVSDRWIRLEPVLENVRKLQRLRRSTGWNLNTPASFRPADFPLTFREAAKRLGGEDVAAAAVMAGALSIDVFAEFEMDSPVFGKPDEATRIALSLPWMTQSGRRLWGIL